MIEVRMWCSSTGRRHVLAIQEGMVDDAPAMAAWMQHVLLADMRAIRSHESELVRHRYFVHSADVRCPQCPDWQGAVSDA